MAQNFTYPAGFATAVNPSVGLNGIAVPTSSTEVAGKDPGGLLKPLSVDTAGVLNVAVGSSTLPTGAATSANQVTEIASLSSIDTKLTSQALATKQDTGNTSLASIDGKFNSLGQKTMAASAPVVLASDQSTLNVAVSNFPATQPISGTVTAVQATGTNLHTVTDSGSVTAASQSGTWNITNISGTVSLPTGAATAAKQPALGVAGTASADVITVQGIASMTALRVDGSAVTQPVSGTVTANLGTIAGVATEATLSSLNGKVTAVNTGAVVVSSSALPTGAATSALQTTLSGQLPTTLGQKTSAASLAVVLPSDQTITVGPSTGRAKANVPTLNDYTSVPVTSATYVQLIASTTATTNLVEIFDSSGVSLFLAVGAAASEVNQFIITPGGNGQVPLAIPSGSRVSVKATSTSATVGFLVVNLYT